MFHRQSTCSPKTWKSHRNISATLFWGTKGDQATIDI